MTKWSPILKMPTILVQGNSVHLQLVSTSSIGILCVILDQWHAGLFVNGKFTANQVYNNRGGIRLWITAGSSIALSLKKGDEVYIMDVHGGTAPTLRSYFTAFGGVRIN